jgi:glycerophosphoryl diester phosphodiesterase
MESSSLPNRKLEIIAHRGESMDAPENTMAAFRLAFARGDEAIELDTQLTRDNELIVCHDPDTLRTTGVKQIIRESTLSDLQELEGGSWKGSQWAGEKLPALDQVLAALPRATRCFIEIKVGPEAVPPLEKLVKKHENKDAQLVIISFEAATIAEVKRRMPYLEAHLLSWFEHDKLTLTWSPDAQSLIDLAHSIGADGLGLDHVGPVDHSFVQQAKLSGLALYAWTIDDVERARQLIDAGVDGITTNRGAWMREQLQFDRSE